MNGKACNHHYLHRLYTHCTDLYLFTFATSPRQCVNIFQDSSLTSKNFPHPKFQTIDANRERPRKAHHSDPGAWSPKRGKGRNLTNRPHKDFEIPRSLGERAGGAERVIVAKSIKRSVRFSPGSYHVSVLETFKKFHIIFFFSLSLPLSGESSLLSCSVFSPFPLLLAGNMLRSISIFRAPMSNCHDAY